jgi:hypothetical protein
MKRALFVLAVVSSLHVWVLLAQSEIGLQLPGLNQATFENTRALLGGGLLLGRLVFD